MIIFLLVPSYDPMEAYDLSVRGDCVQNSFSLTPAEVNSGEAMATFDLTPAGGDGMIFNLTPVSQTQQLGLTSVGQAESNSTSNLASLGFGFDMGNIGTGSPMYTKELSNTISAMTFSPPLGSNIDNSHSSQLNFSPAIQVSTSGNLTPDFTGLLPPPPPTVHDRSNSRPPPQLLAMAPDKSTEQNSRATVETYHPNISTPSPAASPISGTSPLGSPPSIASPATTPRPHKSPRHTHSLHQAPLEMKPPTPAISPKSQLTQLLQATNTQSAHHSPTSITPNDLNNAISSRLPSQASPNMSSHLSPAYPPSSPLQGTSKQAAKISPRLPSYPPIPSPTYHAHKEAKTMSFNSPSFLQSQVSPKSQHQKYSPQQYSHPPPPYKSPPYSTQFYSGDHQSLLGSALQSPTLPQDMQATLSQSMSPSKSTLQIAPSVTLTKKQKVPVEKSPPPFPFSPSPSPVQSSLPPYQAQFTPPQSDNIPPQQLHSKHSSHSGIQSPSQSNLPSPRQPNLQSPHESHSSLPSPHQTSLQPPQQPSPHQSHMNLPPPSESPKSLLHASISTPHTQQPPPPYDSHQQPKLPSYSLDELKDLPGVNLKKSTVDLNTYVNSVVQNRHPHFANIDGFAERCLACIVRKIRSNLPTLKALEAISLCGSGGVQTDPGCVLIPRMKDGRITIARPGGGAGGTKKIHPHLALVQIFKNPSVVNHNTLASSPNCAAPFVAKGEGEGEMVCISPLHYHVDTHRVKSPSTPKKKPPIHQTAPQNHLGNANALLDHIRAMEQQKLDAMTIDPQQEIAKLLGANKMEKEPLSELIGSSGKKMLPPKKQTVGPKSKDTKRAAQLSDSDFLSDSEDEVDWVKKWNEERVEPLAEGVQEFNEDDLVKNVEVLAIKKSCEGREELVPAEKILVDRLKIREGCKDLISGRYDLGPIKALQRPKPKKSDLKKQCKAEKPVTTVRKKPGPKPKKKLGEAWISDPNKGKANLGEKQKPCPDLKLEIPSNPMHLEVKEEIIQLKEEKEEEKDEAVIQHLLEDIKGSFESQFEMDLQNFGNHEEPTFSNQDFSMTNAFNLSSLDDLSKDSFAGPPVLSTGVTSGSSDAMFGGAGSGLELPGLVASWEDKAHEDHREQRIQYSQENSFRQNISFSGRSQSDPSQDLPYSRLGRDGDGVFRGQEELFDREPEDLTFSSRRSDSLSFSHRPPEDLTFGHSEPEDLTFSRHSEDLTFGNSEPQDLTFSSNRSSQQQQQLGSDQTNTTEFGSTSGFLSAGTISQEQFLDMFDQD